MIKIDKKTEEILASIDSLFSDTSVSQETTLENLQAIQESVDMKVEAIQADLNSQGD